MEVTRDSWSEAAPFLDDFISRSSFVSLDLEFSG
jgi:hypothetical protein